MEGRGRLCSHLRRLRGSIEFRTRTYGLYRDEELPDPLLTRDHGIRRDLCKHLTTWKRYGDSVTYPLSTPIILFLHSGDGRMLE